jgi:hypothetical protein
MNSAHTWTNVRGYGEIRVNDFSLIKQKNRYIHNRIPALPTPSFTNVDRGAAWSAPFNSPYWKRNLDYYNYQLNN